MEKMPRRSFLAGVTASLAATSTEKAESAEVIRGMTWQQTVAAMQDDVRRAKTEQAAFVARVPASSIAFYVKRGELDHVKSDLAAENRSMRRIFKEVPGIDRIGSFHTHPEHTARQVDKKSGLRIYEALINQDGVPVPGKETTNLRHSAPFSIEDIEYSIFNLNIGLNSNNTFATVHGAFDTFGLWYWEPIGPNTINKLSPPQMSRFEEEIKKANRYLKNWKLST